MHQQVVRYVVSAPLKTLKTSTAVAHGLELEDGNGEHFLFECDNAEDQTSWLAELRWLLSDEDWCKTVVYEKKEASSRKDKGDIHQASPDDPAPS